MRKNKQKDICISCETPCKRASHKRPITAIMSLMISRCGYYMVLGCGSWISSGYGYHMSSGCGLGCVVLSSQYSGCGTYINHTKLNVEIRLPN